MQPRRSSDGEKYQQRQPIVVASPTPNLPDLTNLPSLAAWVVDKGFSVAVAAYLLTTFTNKMDQLTVAISTNSATVATFALECGKLIGPTR